MFAAFDISTSGLVAQRMRLNAITSNIANISTLTNEAGEAKPYQPRFVVFQVDEDPNYPAGTAGVKVSSVEIADVSQVPPLYKYAPDHPLAIQEGKWKDHVAYPNIDLHTEFVDALEASRAYEANIGVIEITKNMAQQTLQILA